MMEKEQEDEGDGIPTNALDLQPHLKPLVVYENLSLPFATRNICDQSHADLIFIYTCTLYLWVLIRLFTRTFNT